MFVLPRAEKKVNLVDLYESLNGLEIVALVSAESDPSARSPLAIPYVQGPAPPDPFSSYCTDLALVRGVSVSAIFNGLPSERSAGNVITLQLLIPVPTSILLSARPRHLVKGEIELPVWGCLNFRESRKPVPNFIHFFELEGEG